MRYVIDTNALISFFSEVFQLPGSISRKCRQILSDAIYSDFSLHKLSIPSIVFIEIFDKQNHSEEFAAKIYYEFFIVLKNSNNVEIRPIDREIQENLIRVDSVLNPHYAARWHKNSYQTMLTC